jgi:hypothetical protein
MEAPVPDTVLSALDELRRKLRGELEGLVEKRSGLEQELKGLGEAIEAKQRMLELLEATERQLAGQGRGQPDLQAGGPAASTQVRGSAKLQDIGKPGSPTYGLCLCCDSPRQRFPHRPFTRRFSLSPQGRCLWPCGGTTCCRC